MCQEQCLQAWASYWTRKIFSIGTPGGGPDWAKPGYNQHLQDVRSAQARLAAERIERLPPILTGRPDNLVDSIGEALGFDKVEEVARAVADLLFNGLSAAVCGEQKADGDGVTLCPK